MRRIMFVAVAGWAMAGVLLGVQSVSAGTVHRNVPHWLMVYKQRPLTACSGGVGVIVFARPTFVQQAAVCKDGQVFVEP